MTFNDILNIIGNILGPLAVGIVIWLLGKRDIEKRAKNDAIKDLMAFRGDMNTADFRRALNKVSVTFHDDQGIRIKVREIYEAINNQSLTDEIINRKIVGLIYKLCQENGFKGLSEYDIDQAFPESKQSPDLSMGTNVNQETGKNINHNSKKQTSSLKRTKKT